jgi:hypothetical protein
VATGPRGPHPAAPAGLHLLLTSAGPFVGRRRRRRTRHGADVNRPASHADVIGYLRAWQITLTYHPATAPCRQTSRETPRLSLASQACWYSGQFGRVQAAAADPLDAHDQALLGIWAAHQRVTFEPVTFGELPLLGRQ